MKNILITGGTGFIGQELRMLLLQEGHYITVISRSPENYKDEAAKNQQFISWDGDLVGAMNTADAVIHLAGEGIFDQRWNEDVKQRIYNSRIDSTKKLVAAMEKAENKPAVFISASASGIYGNQSDTVLDESASIDKEDFLAKVCIDWEAESQKATALGVRVVNPRIGIVLEKNGGALEKMIPPFKFGMGGPVGDGKQYMSWIHREDLLNALIYPITNTEIKGAYNVCAPNPATMNEFAAILASVMSRPNLFRVPKIALELMYGEGAKPITDSIRMQPKELQVNDFEFHFEELEEALADILE